MLNASSVAGRRRHAWSRVLVMCAVAASGLCAGGTAEGARAASGARLLDGAEERVARAQARWAQRRDTREARDARVASRTHFAGQDAAAAVRTIDAELGDLLDREAWRPLHGLAVHRHVSATSAVVETGPRRERSVLQSTLPLFAEHADGERRPVDLELREHGSGWSPASPLAPLTIGARADDGIRLTSAGVGLRTRGARAVAGRQRRGGIVFPNAGTDTDVVVAAVGQGAELSWVLRSRRSSERIDLEVDPPAGGALRAVPESTGIAAEVLDADGGVRATIQRPAAFDADGAPVEVSAQVVGTTLRLGVSHADADVRYPLYVDPYVYTAWGCLCTIRDDATSTNDGWFNFSTVRGTRIYDAGPSYNSGTNWLFETLGTNMHLKPRGGGLYATAYAYTRPQTFPYHIGYWKWVAPPKAFVYRANVMHVLHTARQSYLDLGLVDRGHTRWEGAAWKTGSTWRRDTHSETGPGRVLTMNGGHQELCAYWNNQTSACVEDPPEPRTAGVVDGDASEGNGVTMSLVLPNRVSPYTEEVSMLAADVFLRDRNTPRATTPRTNIGSATWYPDDAAAWKTNGRQLYVDADSADDGLGVSTVEAVLPSGEVRSRSIPCVSPHPLNRPPKGGSIAVPAPEGVDNRSACPKTSPAPLPPPDPTQNVNIPVRRGDASGEGRLAVRVRVRDVVGNVSTATGSQDVTLNVDTSRPVFDAHALPSQVVNLAQTVEVTARDGDAWGSTAQWRSGVRRMEVWLRRAHEDPSQARLVDSQTVSSSSCTVRHTQTGEQKQVDHSCPMTHRYTFPTPDHAPGGYVAEFRAFDHAGNPYSSTLWTFTKLDLVDPALTVDHSPEDPPPGWVRRHEADVFADASDLLGSGLYDLTFVQPLMDGHAQRTPYRYRSPLTGEACRGDATSPCPWRPDGREGEQHYSTDTWREGIVDATLQVEDAAGNNSERVSFRLKVDRAAPKLDTPSGDLWDRRNRDDDHRFEGLYEAEHTISVVAHDGTEADRRSGVEEIRYELADASGAVVDTQSVAGTCDPTDGCGWDLPATFTLQTDAFPDGDYTIRLTAVDQLDHESTPEELRVTIDRRGDIYKATEWIGNPSDGGALTATEWTRYGAWDGRSETGAEIATRHAIECPGSDGQCGEVRQRVVHNEEGQLAGDDNYSVVVGESVDDPRLEPVSDLTQHNPPGNMEETGPIASVAEPWQWLPPAHGASFQRFRHETVADEEDEGDPNAKRVAVHTWVDERTRLPIKQDVTNLDGTGSQVIHFVYDRSRRETDEVPTDHFAVPAPPDANSTEHTRYTGASEAQPDDLQDRQTGTPFNAFWLGDSISLATIPLCHVSSNHYTEDVVAPSFAPTPLDDPLVVPDAAGPITAYDVDYRLRSLDGCGILGLLQGDPDLSITAYSATSSVGHQWTETYDRALTALEAEGPLDPDRGGRRLTDVGGVPATVIWVPFDADEITAVVQVGTTVLTIKGPFLTNNPRLQSVVDSLEVIA